MRLDDALTDCKTLTTTTITTTTTNNNISLLISPPLPTFPPCVFLSCPTVICRLSAGGHLLQRQSSALCHAGSYGRLLPEVLRRRHVFATRLPCQCHGRHYGLDWLQADVAGRSAQQGCILYAVYVLLSSKHKCDTPNRPHQNVFISCQYSAISRLSSLSLSLSIPLQVSPSSLLRPVVFHSQPWRPFLSVRCPRA